MNQYLFSRVNEIEFHPNLLKIGAALLMAKVLIFFSSYLRWKKIADVEKPKKSKPKLHRLMTSIGRFTLRSQTEQNPSILTCFIALAHEADKDLLIEEFSRLWNDRVLKKYDRFRSTVCKRDEKYFHIDDHILDKCISKNLHPIAEFNELEKSVEEMLTSPLNTHDKLWEAKVSSDIIGSSGAINEDQLQHLKNEGCDRETLLMLRTHHALCDGVSMGLVLGDASDEGELLRAEVAKELQIRHDRNAQRSVFERFLQVVIMTLFYSVGSLYALWAQFWRSLFSSNPFSRLSVCQNAQDLTGRSITWRTIDSVDSVKSVAKSASKSATLNDVAVSMVSYAIHKQLEEHQHQGNDNIRLPKKVNVVIPVHLEGGIMAPGARLGNKIGAFVSRIPLPISYTPKSHVRSVSRSLKEGKQTPAPLIAWRLCKFFSDFTPDWFAKLSIRYGNANAVAVVSNIRGFPFKVHYEGRSAAFLCAFLPLPPDIPIGVVVSSYNGQVSFSLVCEKRIVPDAHQFADWMLQYYSMMQTTS
jgi:hypothetical protein